MRHDICIKIVFCPLIVQLKDKRQNSSSEMRVHTTNKIRYTVINACFLTNSARVARLAILLPDLAKLAKFGPPSANFNFDFLV